MPSDIPFSFICEHKMGEPNDERETKGSRPTDYRS